LGDLLDLETVKDIGVGVMASLDRPLADGVFLLLDVKFLIAYLCRCVATPFRTVPLDSPPSHICHICGVVLFTIYSSTIYYLSTCNYINIITIAITITTITITITTTIIIYYIRLYIIVLFNIYTSYPTNPTYNNKLDNLLAN